MVQRKGILIFLAITFAITYAVEGAMIAAGFQFISLTSSFVQVVVAAVWIEGLARPASSDLIGF